MQQFQSSRLKIKRARNFIDETKRAIEDFLTKEFCKLHVETDASTGQAAISVVSTAEPPAEIALSIGDAVHNLRAALDHAVVDILGAEGAKHAFPVAKDKSNPGAHSTFQLIKKRFPDLATLLVDKIVIHDTGDVCIWAISQLDNTAKHNLLIPFVSVQAIENFDFINEVSGATYTRCGAAVDG
ncbi:hypothetical protein [Bradyrhizobium sp. AUGA SZCCT0283]|uniref:hypothetical protein n=1 Tax=Bradyrhizobium sp. AUGA SZCCT0283 TaxID=2807671 RepID=UPI001BA71F1D|nr:hypothetical protein [Bradyrhizobium sp. AUGA SZCCT0283]MBR1275041.1 hypothetical protein [Bradyrhizobium sp. AUGA SZCCT0283]